MSAENRLTFTNFAVALAAGLAMFTYGGALTLPAAAAETHYLAGWATLLLISIAGLAVPPAYELAGAAVLTTLVVWAVPHGPTRGAAVGLLLVLALAAAALRRLEISRGQPTWTWAVAVALGLQLLCRADRLLELVLEPRLLIGVIGLPLGAAVALMSCSLAAGALPALLACATAALLVPGFSVSVTLGLLSVAVGLRWGDGRVPKGILVAAAAGLLAAAGWWQPALAPLAALTLVACALRAGWKTVIPLALVIAALLVTLPEARPWHQVGGLLALVPLLLPGLLVPDEDRRAQTLLGLLLAVLALRTVAGAGGLAAPLVLIALSLRPGGIAARLQVLWTGVLLAAVALLAGYPWLREPALETALGLFGASITWGPAIAAVALVWVLSLLCATLADRWRRMPCRPLPLGGLTLALLAWWNLPAQAELPLADRIEVLSAAEPQIAIDLESPLQIRSVVIDSYLENSAALAAGTPVARVMVVGADGQRLGWLLRAGFETGEWAARRPDVANLPGFRAPPHWLAWVAPGGEVFAQRYRAVWAPAESLEVVRVELTRPAELPPEPTLAVFHLELRR